MVRRKKRKKIFITVFEARAPATKIRESPGRKGVTTMPVSKKIMRNKIA